MNIKDTPMDYKQFEGHTPGPWEVFNTFSDGFAIDFNDGNLMRRFVAFKIYNKGDAALIAAAPDLLKENKELKLELQKQKELNAELVNGLKKAKERIVYDNPGYEKYESAYCKSVILELESLIKKSSEI